MENYTEIKNFLLSKTFQVYITILSTLCFVLPLNSYLLNLNIVNVNFVFAGAIFVAISAAAKFTDHIEITNGKTTQYFYRGELYHTDNNEADAVWYGGDKNNYRVTFVYADGKKIVYVNGKKIQKWQQQ